MNTAPALPRISVELSRCEGHGLCADIAPDVYDLDASGDVMLVHDTLPADLVDQAERGARACPVAALRVER